MFCMIKGRIGCSPIRAFYTPWEIPTMEFMAFVCACCDWLIVLTLSFHPTIRIGPSML